MWCLWHAYIVVFELNKEEYPDELTDSNPALCGSLSVCHAMGKQA